VQATAAGGAAGYRLSGPSSATALPFADETSWTAHRRQTCCAVAADHGPGAPARRV